MKEGVLPARPVASVRAVAFDMDGTLTERVLDFEAIRAECGIPSGKPILEHAESAPEPVRRRIFSVLERHEREAASRCALRDGAREVLEELGRRGLKTGLLTRNSAESVRTVLKRFSLRFDCCLTRQDCAPKPSPEPVWKMARQLGVAPAEMLVVGDYVFDMQAGRAAGARTVFLRVSPESVAPPEADYVIDDLRALLGILPAGALQGGCP